MRKLKFILFYLLCVFSLALSAAGEKELEALSQTLDLYMKNKIAAAEEEAMEKTYEFDAKSPAGLLLDYLSGNKSIKASHIVMASEKDRDLSAMVSLCLFARMLASKNSNLDSFELENYLCNYLSDLKSCKSSVPKAWKESVEKWLNWCRSDFKYTPGLPPLLVARCSKGGSGGGTGKGKAVSLPGQKDIKYVSYQDFCAIRSQFKKRPKPMTLDFSKKEMQKYIDTLPSVKLKKDEAVRCNVVNKFKPYLVVLISKNPYHGKIALRRKRFKGSISMANENSVRIKTRSSSLRTYKWSDLAPEQYIYMINYYAKQRTDGFGAVVSKEERARQAAEDYLQLAFYCDWFGLYKEALKYAKKSVQLSPDMASNAQKFIYGIDK